MSTKKERKPITLHHVRESHVVEIDNITRVQVTPLSYGQQGIKLALTHRMNDDMDLSLAAKRTEKNSLAKNNKMVDFEPGECMKMYSSEKRKMIFLIYSPGSKFNITSLSSLFIPFILCKFNVCGLVCRYCNFVHFILFLLSNSNFKKRWKEFGIAPPSIPEYRKIPKISPSMYKPLQI